MTMAELAGEKRMLANGHTEPGQVHGAARNHPSRTPRSWPGVRQIKVRRQPAACWKTGNVLAYDHSFSLSYLNRDHFPASSYLES